LALCAQQATQNCLPLQRHVLLQARNYERRKQQEQEREQLFEGALKKFNAKDIEGVRAPDTSSLFCPHLNEPHCTSHSWSAASQAGIVLMTCCQQLLSMRQALIDFENVLAMEPKNYVGDNFSRITDIYRVTQYNIACCYAAEGSVRHCSLLQPATRACGRDVQLTARLNLKGCSISCSPSDDLMILLMHCLSIPMQVDPGLEALSDALRSGFDQYKVPGAR
jgi:hypothetical protein